MQQRKVEINEVMKNIRRSIRIVTMQLNCKNALFFLIINMSISCANAADITMMKYGYGLIYWGKKAYTADPMVYPLQNSYAYNNIMG